MERALSVYKLPSKHDSRLSERAALELVEALEREVPEVRLGVVEVVRCVRAPGLASKVMVRGEVPNPVGVVVGRHGERIKAVEKALGERHIQVVGFAATETEKVRQALRPGVAGRVEVGPDETRVQPLPTEAGRVIGAKGINVRLASYLLRHPIRVVVEAAV